MDNNMDNKMDNNMDDKMDNSQDSKWIQYFKNHKKLVIGIAAAILVLVLISIPLSTIIIMHNSVYDCSFSYEKTDDVLYEIARKHTYYEANDKAVEIELNQDLINSLIKDNLSSLDISLPEKVSIEEVLFNTKDQRLYVNAKYGNLNTPISVKLNVSLSDEGITVTADDLMLGKKKAPGFVKKQVPQDALMYSIKYKDFDIPQLFTVKDIKFGSGIVKVTIQLDADKITELALDYRKDLMSQIDSFKDNQSIFVSTFITKFLGTGILSEEKTREYVKQALNNGELMNSAVYFATADNLNVYTDKIQESQQKVAAWAEPLQVIKYYGSIQETMDTILYDEKLNQLLGWFMPQEIIQEYTNTAENYYALYEEINTTFDDFIASIDTRAVHQFAALLLEYAAQTDNARDFLADQVDFVDTEAVQALALELEKDKGMAGEYISMLDPYYVDEAKAYIADFDNTKAYIKDSIMQVDLKPIDKAANEIRAWDRFIKDSVTLLKNKDYEELNNIFILYQSNNTQRQAFINKYLIKKNSDIVTEYKNAVKEYEKLMAEINGTL